MEIFMIVFIAMTLISILTCVEYARELKILHKGYTRKTEEFQRLRELRDMHKNGYSFESMMLSEKEAKKLKKHRKIVAKNIYGEDVKSKFFSNPNIKKQVKAAVESAKRNVF
jgi:hypothetical protein